MAARRQPVADEQVGLAPIEIGLHVRFVELDREIPMRVGQAGQVRREKARDPFPGRHAHDTAGVVAERHPPAVDHRRRVGHALGHR